MTLERAAELLAEKRAKGPAPKKTPTPTKPPATKAATATEGQAAKQRRRPTRNEGTRVAESALSGHLRRASRAATASASRPRPRCCADWLATQGREVVLTFEPGDTAIGATLRDLVLEPGQRATSRRAPRRCCTPPTRPSTSTRWCCPALRARRGGDLRPLRRLDARLPGRRPRAGAASGSSRSPAGPPRTCCPTSPSCSTSTRRSGVGRASRRRTASRAPAPTSTRGPGSSSSTSPRATPSTTSCCRRAPAIEAIAAQVRAAGRLASVGPGWHSEPVTHHRRLGRPDRSGAGGRDPASGPCAAPRPPATGTR